MPSSQAITITKQNNTTLTLNTQNKFVDYNPQFVIDVQEAVTAANTATADVSVDSTAGSSAGVNISGVIGTKTTTEPATGYYIRMDASGSGSSQVTAAGWVATGTLETASTTATKYFPVTAATVTTTPAIDSGTGIITATATTTAGYVPVDTHSATLQLTTKAADVYNTSSEDQTIEAGRWLTGNQTIKAVTTSNISASNIKSGVNVKVGDTSNNGRIANVTGTFTDSSTVTSGQTAAAAGQIRTGYSAWVNGGEVLGSLRDTSVTQGTTAISGTTVTRGEATWGSGVISAGSIGAATFANTATENVEYVDISDTSEAPVLISGGYFFINQGYTDNLKISLAKLVPNSASAGLSSDKILSGYSAYDSDGALIAGNIESITGGTYYAGSSDTTVQTSGKYLTSNITIGKIVTSNISAANIKYGTTVTVGDEDSGTRHTNVTGTFTQASTVSSGQTAATAGQILSGYSAWVDAAEVQGSIATKTASDLSASGDTVTVPAGFYAEQTTKSVDAGAYSASVSAHAVTATPVVTGSISGSVSNIGTTTQPSGTDGTDYWTITPSGSVTTVGIATAVGQATIGTAGYIATGSTTSSDSTVNITPRVDNGSTRYIVKGTVTNNTSGGTAEATINRGSQIKIGAGYYPSDLYYAAEKNSGILTIDTTKNVGTISVDGYADVNLTGVNIPTPSTGTNTFSVKVPNGAGEPITFVFSVDTSGNVTITVS